jgi:hypothetical protein
MKRKVAPSSIQPDKKTRSPTKSPAKSLSFRYLSADKKQNIPEIAQLLSTTPNLVFTPQKGMSFDIEGKEYAFAPQIYGSLTKLVSTLPYEKHLALYVASG